MSKKDYTKFSKWQEPEIEAEQVEREPEPQKLGIVINCNNLNIRKHPDLNSDIICAIKRSTEVMIDDNESTEDFYKICTVSGIEGFCMKQYIEVRQ